jgi:hypothetical protein
VAGQHSRSPGPDGDRGFSSRFQVAVVYGANELLAKVTQRIDMGLELAPTGKTIAARYRELGLR